MKIFGISVSASAPSQVNKNLNTILRFALIAQASKNKTLNQLEFLSIQVEKHNTYKRQSARLRVLIPSTILVYSILEFSFQKLAKMSVFEVTTKGLLIISQYTSSLQPYIASNNVCLSLIDMQFVYGNLIGLYSEFLESYIITIFQKLFGINEKNIKTKTHTMGIVRFFSNLGYGFLRIGGRVIRYHILSYDYFSGAAFVIILLGYLKQQLKRKEKKTLNLTKWWKEFISQRLDTPFILSRLTSTLNSFLLYVVLHNGLLIIPLYKKLYLMLKLDLCKTLSSEFFFDYSFNSFKKYITSTTALMSIIKFQSLIIGPRAIVRWLVIRHWQLPGRLVETIYLNSNNIGFFLICLLYAVIESGQIMFLIGLIIEIVKFALMSSEN